VKEAVEESPCAAALFWTVTTNLYECASEVLQVAGEPDVGSTTPPA
jgi:hypothetical protein